MHIPEGFGTVTPYLVVDDAPGYIEFLVAAFGAVECGRHLDGTRVAHAQIRIGTSTLMLGEGGLAYPATTGNFYLFVENVDAAMALAIGAGAVQISEIANQPYGDRQGGVRDRAGNVWWISQRLTAEPYSF